MNFILGGWHEDDPRTSETQNHMTQLYVINVINYKHDTNALAFTFKAGSWQI